MHTNQGHTKELLSTVTSKGQVTIPIEIREILGVYPHDKVAFVVEDDQIKLTRTGSVVKKTAGMLKSNKAPFSAEKLRKIAEDAIAKDVIQRSK